ncbi:MAG: hypothetical protein AB7F78_12285 [Hyphomicrobiaceae bacterium]
MDTRCFGFKEFTKPRLSRKQPAYPPGLRQQLINLGRAGRTPEDLAREFEPSAQAIRAGVAHGRRRSRPAQRRPDERRAWELWRLRKENKQLKLEREVLSKAAG